MDAVRYTPLLDDCFPVVIFLAERITQVDSAKSNRAFNEEIELLISHLQTIRRLNAITHEASTQPLLSLNVINLN